MTDVMDAFSLLKIADTPVLSQFLHDCVDDLIGTKQANFDSYNSDIEWTISDFNKAKKSIQTFYRESVINDEFNLKTMKTDMGENVKEEIRNCFEIRKEDIFEGLVKEVLVKNGYNLVENFDWKLRWILGSSKLSSIREALLQVDLHCLKKSNRCAGNPSVNTVNFEVNLEKLNQLISQLETAQNELAFASSDSNNI